MAGFGIVAGLSAGTTNVMVAVLIIYFLSLDTPRATMVPTLNASTYQAILRKLLLLLALILIYQFLNETGLIPGLGDIDG